MEFVKLLAGGWLAVTCFHGLFETISERRAEHCLGIVLYATAAFGKTYPKRAYLLGCNAYQFQYTQS